MREGMLDRVMGACVWSAAAVVFAAFAWILGDLVWAGASELSWSFLVDAPERAGLGGGIGPMLVSTLGILSVCLVTAVPIGLGAALYLTEFAREDGTRGGFVRASLDVLAGVPSIVFGLFGNALFCVAFGLGFSILSGGLTLACMVLPLLVRSIELGLRAVPDDYRLAGAALDLSRPRMFAHVLLPAAAPGIVGGLLLGVGRALAETAALIFTSGYVARTPESLLDSGRALSVHVYDLAMNVPGGDKRAYASALVLVLVLLVVNLVSTWLVERFLARRANLR